MLKRDTVADLADAQGYEALPEDFLERIAAGASHTIAAVRASVDASLFDAEPAQFLPTLESLVREEDQV